jgi:2-hydroxy-6-oxonona-2,4-dienedioate hydrolase
LIVWGQQDELAKVALAEKAHRQIKGSRLVILDPCGHLPQEEQPKALEQALTTFLDTAGPTATTAAASASR